TGIIPLLDSIDPNWSWHVTRIEILHGFVWAHGQLTLCGIAREGVGENSPNGRDQPVDGDTVKGAVTDAFKRAALMFGVGLYLRNAPKVWVETTGKEWEDKKTALAEFAKWYRREYGNDRSSSAPSAKTRTDAPPTAQATSANAHTTSANA